MKISKKQLQEMVKKEARKQIKEQWFSGGAKNDAFEKLDQLKELMGADELLDELGRVLEGQELLDSLNHIIEDHDIRELMDDEEDEQIEDDDTPYNRWI